MDMASSHSTQRRWYRGSLGWPILVGTALILVAGCSSFRRQWRSQVPDPVPPVEMTGRWEGIWRSDVNGHSGRLRGIIEQSGQDTYQARFRATFWKIFRYGYTVDLTAEPERDGDLRFRGEANLGWWAGGVFRYEGKANATTFKARYEAKRDSGIFEMGRPASH
jgi:hypothetical protein